MAKARKLLLFRETAPTWTPVQLADFFGRAAAALLALRDPPESQTERENLLKRAHEDLSPIVFSTAEPPRQTVRENFRQLADADPKLVSIASAALLRRPLANLSPEIVTEHLQMLAAIDFIDGEFIAAIAVEKLINIPAWRSFLNRMGEAAIQLAGASAGALSALSLSQRLSNAGLLSWDVAEAALHMTASTSPGRISMALSPLQNAAANVAGVTRADIAAALSEAVYRSSPISVLAALLDLEIDQHKNLIQAAFARDIDAPFELVELTLGDTSNPRPTVLHNGAPTDLEQLQPTPSLKMGFNYWQRTLKHALGYQPRLIGRSDLISIPKGAHARLAARAARPPGPAPLDEVFREMLRTPDQRPN